MTDRIRNGKIDFMKFIFSLVIVVHHGRNLMGDEVSLFLGGSFAVEFFFIVSGYFMMASIKKSPPRTNMELFDGLGSETFTFICKKIKSFCPEIIVAFFFCSRFYLSYNRKITYWDF